MFSLVLFPALVALCSAQYPYNPNQYPPQPYQPQQQHQQNSNGAPVHYVSIGQQLQGDYKFGYNTGNDGSFREETRNPDGSVSGAYGYIDASGKQKIIRYTAGKDGFKAEGDDIPKAPPAPQPTAPQPAYQPQPQYQAQQYQPQQYQPQQYQPQPAYNNYVQPQPTQNYNQYAAPQQYNSNQGSYNPFAYNNPAPGQQAPPPVNLLSYNIGGQPNQYQG
ncbi:endocuticle structural glycoprotein SgAbd-8-like [Uloborus diversus]|uniref:endocuticle structural glycoprotein SgAbd-8-like n=1 Tax=Uloborus diversus TaxID=327109 RepID=UPI002409201A|nr:endocuticle structural glycoprotein SgAbd-8-like [Uloborus diversus]